MSARRQAGIRVLELPGAKIAIGVVASLGVLITLFTAVTSDPWSALQGLLTGAVSNPGRVTQWIAYSSLLMITGSAVCLVFRAGMFTIGVEGQVFVGALLSGIVALQMGPGPATLIVAVAAAAFAGFLWGLLPGLLKAYLGADELVTSLMLNYVATYLFSFIVKQFLTPPHAGYPVSDYFAPSTWFPNIGISPAIPTTLIVGLAVCGAVSILLSRTRFGYKLRVVGDSPRFAHANGLPVRRLIWLSIALSGGIAGIAGAALAFGSTHRLVLDMATGIGFDGMTVALIAFLRPGFVPIAALAYGYLSTGGDVIQITSNVPSQVVTVIQGIILLLIATALRQREKKVRISGKPAVEDVQAEPGPVNSEERTNLARASAASFISIDSAESKGRS